MMTLALAFFAGMVAGALLYKLRRTIRKRSRRVVQNNFPIPEGQQMLEAPVLGREREQDQEISVGEPTKLPEQEDRPPQDRPKPFEPSPPWSHPPSLHSVE
jgi:hypothetical protein